MTWNWEQSDWPHFRWSEARLAKAEALFLLEAGTLQGVARHLKAGDAQGLQADVMSEEAIQTSRIEGEVLDRESVQSSIRRYLGLQTADLRSRPKEAGISELMVDLHQNFATPLSEPELLAWHRMLMRGLPEGLMGYRTHPEPMQVVSNRLDHPTVHFEAPPSWRVPEEMRRFIEWFNRSSPFGERPLPALTRAALAHLYFVSIHPFEDGNGRIARVLAEKCLAQSLGRPSLLLLASTIMLRRRDYYAALERANRHNEVTEWLAWFAAICIEAQRRTMAQIEFVLDKTRLLDRLEPLISDRQKAVLVRMLREGPTGFKGGLSAGKYATIAKVSAATATRDLAKLVRVGALMRSGENRGSRYHLPIAVRDTKPMTIDEVGLVQPSR